MKISRLVSIGVFVALLGGILPASGDDISGPPACPLSGCTFSGAISVPGFTFGNNNSQVYSLVASGVFVYLEDASNVILWRFRDSSVPAVNYWASANSASGGTLVNAAIGSDANISVSIDSKGTGLVEANNIQIANVNMLPLSGTTGSIGGSALLAGACASGTVTVTGATTGMVVEATPVTYPGAGFDWGRDYVSAANTVTVQVCADVAGTPTASAYNVRVIQ